MDTTQYQKMVMKDLEQVRGYVHWGIIVLME